MTREEIVTALREQAERAVGNEWGTALITLGDNLPSAADLIENQQREMEALRQANEGLRYPMIYTPEEIAKLQGDLIQRNAELLRAREELKDLYSRIDQEGNCAEPQCDEICRAALETFGKSSQMQVAIEEMSELTKELCKNGRGQENTTHIAEEIADVEIMLRQMVMLFDCAGQVETFHRYKLERLAERIKEAAQ